MTVATDEEAAEFLRQASEYVAVSKALAEVSLDLVKAVAHIERLTEENRSLMQTIRRVLRAQPVTER